MGKILKPSKLQSIPKNKKLVLVGGCFDILHIGHITFLEKSKSKGDLLVVLLESDKKIKLSKGENRPINTQQVRAQILASLTATDFIVLLPEDMQEQDYDQLTLKINPSVIATTSGDPALAYKKRSADLVGAKVLEVIPKISDHSSTKLWKILKDI